MSTLYAIEVEIIVCYSQSEYHLGFPCSCLSLSWRLPSLIRHHEQKISVAVSGSVLGAVSSPCVSLHTYNKLCSAHSKGISVAVSLKHPFPFSALAFWYELDPWSSGSFWPSPLSTLPTINFKSAWQDCVWNDGGMGLCISQKRCLFPCNRAVSVWHSKSYRDMPKKGCPRSKPVVEVMHTIPQYPCMFTIPTKLNLKPVLPVHWQRDLLQGQVKISKTDKSQLWFITLFLYTTFCISKSTF